ncbi:MAG: acyl-CoA dehydratase activase-related protein [Propionibacteriaceae bacterium]|jgi:predicted CoA-substrate-specific enzyme activase|nr:acyl-CoA dehydratase activase-related protein [Propionibacteriaceae bacterium]
MNRTLSLGLDVGSTTVKAVVLDTDGAVIFSDYRRHNADVRGELVHLLEDVQQALPDAMFQVAMTGSGGLGVAKIIGVPFIQEVIAATAAIERFNPEADVVVELGGEDAKITYLHPVPEQRMNGTCAGGTGAFIDQMAVLLKTDAIGLNELASQYINLYPIASRCGVFAKSDIQPLLNQGAAHADIAASVFSAVANQTIAGLACGHPIRGKVIFLGGPLFFLSELRAAYVRALPQVDDFILPENAQLYVAMGAALLCPPPPLSLPHILGALVDARGGTLDIKTMRPLFATKEERAAFDAKHARHHVDQLPLDGATGPLFLGIDAGSTTIKSVLMDPEGRIRYSTYGSNEGDPITAAVTIARQIREVLPVNAHVARSCVTGYGETIVKAALHADEGEIETMAHYRAAKAVAPGVTSVIDIGGQDMKFLKLRNGTIDSIAVNEACSSGCGSFLQTFATTMNTDIATFAAAGCEAENPVDLGSRCTVFMNSSVKAAQKEGAGLADISAGLSYSVVRNALYKVIKLRDESELGDCVVVQGGTFLNDAVLRAFELLTGVEVVRPNIAGLMGAYGAALTAQMHYDPDEALTSAFMARDLDAFSCASEQRTCQLCQNHCKLTITTFDDGIPNVSGNRCDRGASLDKRPKKSEIPNLYDYKYQRLFAYHRLSEKDATRGEIGIPRALGMYEDYPLWFTILTKLGFRVVVSARSSHELFELGMESIPAENVCYPAKLAHGHVEWLLNRGVKTIFFPCVSYERKTFTDADNNYTCPIVAYYPQVVEKNVTRLHEDGVRYLDPFVNLDKPEHLAKRLTEIFADWNVTLKEAKEAVAAGYAELDLAQADIKREGDRALQYAAETGRRVIVLAGRPYHVDPEIHHGIPEAITKLGMVVISEDALTHGMRHTHLERPIRVMDQWTYHTRLYEAAAQVRAMPNANLVQLNSFGCGLDAVTTDEVQEIIESAGDTYTLMKIDEVSNLGAATIRLRSLAAAVGERIGNGGSAARCGSTGCGCASDSASCACASANVACGCGEAQDTNLKRIATDDIPMVKAPPRPQFLAEHKATHTIFGPQMSPIHFRMLGPVFRQLGYNLQVLESASKDDIECGLKFVNNDACFPAVMVIGQLINVFATGGADPDNSSVIITQTGGMCRATNYVGMLRKGLQQAGYGQVPVIALSVSGIESNPGFRISAGAIHRGLEALVMGDVLQTVLLRVRPYERVEGSANALYQRWSDIACEFFASGGKSSAIFGGRLGFRKLVRSCVREFDELPLLNIPRKPRVGVVGEILVKYQPDANNNVVGVIEDEGCEAVLPGLTSFFIYSLAAADWRLANLGVGTKTSVRNSKLGVWFVDRYEKVVKEALASCGDKFDTAPSIYTIRDYAEEVISPGTNAGEGWFLVGEMIELIHSGAPNIICCQPFACLPNHVVGRGMFAELRRQHPEVNLVSIDYDPGASEVNQLNRIKLMVATAHKRGGMIPSMEPWDLADAEMTSR